MNHVNIHDTQPFKRILFLSKCDLYYVVNFKETQIVNIIYT